MFVGVPQNCAFGGSATGCVESFSITSAFPTTGSATGTNLVMVGNGGTLAGGGTTAGASGIVSGLVTVQSGGHIAPGQPVAASGVGTNHGGQQFGRDHVHRWQRLGVGRFIQFAGSVGGQLC